MPLLPGETRESDRYVSGLSFIDDLGKSVKAAAERTQARIEQGYNELASSLSESSRTASAGTPSFSSGYTGGAGHLVPVPTNWEDPALVPMAIVPAVVSVACAVREHGDPLQAAPGTMLLVAGNVFAFSRRVPVRYWCLLPHMIFSEGEVYRLLTGPLLHRDFSQLITNISMLMCSGLALERRRGWKYVAEVLCLTAAASVVRLGSMVLRELLHCGWSGVSLRRMPIAIYGGLGCSATCFALQVLKEHQPVPNRYRGAWAVELPGQWRQLSCWISFAMHAALRQATAQGKLQLLQADLEHDLSGLVAGLGYVWIPRLMEGFQETRHVRAWARTMYGSSSSFSGRGGGYRLGGGGGSDARFFFL
jgi:hypothetical protein